MSFTLKLGAFISLALSPFIQANALRVFQQAARRIIYQLRDEKRERMMLGRRGVET